MRRLMGEIEPVRATAPVDRRIFVFGNPLIYYLTGTLQAVRLQGQTPEYYAPGQWAELVSELREHVPYRIYVRGGYTELLTRDHPEVGELLATRYSTLAKTGEGVWYQRLEPR